MKYFYRQMNLEQFSPGQWAMLKLELSTDFKYFHSSSLVLICSVPLCSGVIINELMDLTANIGKSSC